MPKQDGALPLGPTLNKRWNEPPTQFVGAGTCQRCRWRNIPHCIQNGPDRSFECNALVSSVIAFVSYRAACESTALCNTRCLHPPSTSVKFCMRTWLPVFFLFLSLSASTQTNNAIAITHVTVIDCTGAAARPNSTVVVAGGLISAVGPSEIVKIPPGARVVDENGKFMIPGLWDMARPPDRCNRRRFPSAHHERSDGRTRYGRRSRSNRPLAIRD